MPNQTFFNLEEEKRESIIKAALAEFSNHMYNEASVNTIVEKSGISKGSLYQYFEDKKDVYLYLLEYAGQAKLEFLQTQSPVDFHDFFDGFRTLMIQGTKFSLDNPQYSRLLYRALQGPLVDESLARLKALNRDFMTRLLSEAMDKGEVRRDTSMDVMVFFLSVLTTEFAQFIAEQSETPLDDIYRDGDAAGQFNVSTEIDELMKLIRHGLAPEKDK